MKGATPGVSSSSSVRTSASSYSPALSNETFVDDTGITVDRTYRSKDLPFTLPASWPRPSTTGDDLPSSENRREDILDSFLNGMNNPIVVDDLVRSAAESFQRVEHWYEDGSACVQLYIT
jgi:hypothetical protein